MYTGYIQNMAYMVGMYSMYIYLPMYLIVGETTARRRQRRIPLHSLAIIFNILYLFTQTIAKVGSSSGGAEIESVCA